MTDCTIRPIPVIETRIDKSLMTYRMNFGQTVVSVMYAWLIEGLKERILVDAGASARYMNEVRRMPATGIQTVEEGLKRLGMDPEDIDTVIFTHLHNDHVAEAKRFSKARLLVQRAELDFAKNPHPAVASAYNQEFLEGVRFEALDGDTRICDRISVLSTPGHSPGGQSVSVRTARGEAVIVGMCTIRDNFEPATTSAGGTRVIVPGMHANVLDAYDSLVRIQAIADIIVPCHDQGFQSITTIP